MIRWCSYCQEYMGEALPFDDYSMTHGGCERCFREGVFEVTERIEKARAIAGLYQTLQILLRRRNAEEFKTVLHKMLALKLRPADVVIGILQPLMYDVGQLWAQGKITVADEHLFTHVASEMVGLMHDSLEGHQSFRQSAAPVILLAPTTGNYHTVGLQIVEMILTLHKIPNHTILSPMSADEMTSELRRLKPRYLGLSVAQCSDQAALARLIDHIQSQRDLAGTEIVLG
ncbi:MAG: B12-binding domain-containing protein, partial [Spirochaetia bacterium]|nr:B12-binding domain-containing protein [Spirochaetia bacterium]